MIQPRVERNDVTEMSLAFSVLGTDGQEWSEDFTKREILAANINRGDVSIVTLAANEATSVAFRGIEVSLERRRETAREIGGRITGRRSLMPGIRSTADASACARCEGQGTITIRCPTCRAGTSDTEPDGIEEPPPISSAVDGQRGVELMDLSQARREVEALREGESRKAWAKEVRETHHELQVRKLRGMSEFRERARRQRMVL